MRVPISLFLLLTLGAARAETVYVNDMLRVGVRGQPASDEAALAVVTTGEALEVLERSAGHVKVRTDQGVTGWVSANYLSDEPPARLRLERANTENLRLQKAAEELKTSAGGAMKEAERLRASLADVRRETEALRGRLARFEGDRARFDRRWLYAGVPLLLFLLGFYFGVRQQKRRVSRRLGGLEL